MTDDLVKRLRDECEDANDPIFMTRATLLKAANRIEKLEAALVKVAGGYEIEWSKSSVINTLNIAQILSERIVIAQKALEGKDE